MAEFVVIESVHYNGRPRFAGERISASDDIRLRFPKGYVELAEEPADEPTPVVDEAPDVSPEEPPVQEEAETPPDDVKPRVRRTRQRKGEED